MPKPWVYIAGPVSRGDVHVNVKTACHVWGTLRALGYIGICPHWSAIQQMVDPISYCQWLDYDFELITKCDALLRLDGVSPGADEEVVRARELGIPVVYTLKELHGLFTDWNRSEPDTGKRSPEVGSMSLKRDC